jgi:murein DD-endopeptidase MepM/ murein hydrolase activator NlpD
MNISNEDAAASVESMTSAKGAADTLKNFGIYTADLSTGKEKTQTQIFEELAGRLTAGRGKATVEQTQASIRRGALGVTIDSFFQGDQQGGQMFKQYMLERARGKSMDFASTTQADKAIGTGDNINPLNAQMALYTKQTQAMNAGEPEYIKGINAATGALSLLTDVSTVLVKVLGSASSMLQTLFGNDQAKGAIGALSSGVNYVSKGLGSAVDQFSLANPISMAQSGLTVATMLGGAAAVGAGFVAATGAAQLFGNSTNVGGIPGNSGAGGGRGGNQMGVPIVTRGQGGPGGSNVGDWSRLNSTLGGSSSSANSASSSQAMGPMFDLSSSEAYPVTTVMGVTDENHSYPHHGTDFGFPRGTPVRAIADGVVSYVLSNITREGSLNTTDHGLGNHVVLHHQASNGDQFTTIYGHLQEVKVGQNQNVRKGDVIGLSGNTGRSTGPHLHLEINKGWANNTSGTPIPLNIAKSILTSGGVNGSYGSNPGYDSNGIPTSDAINAGSALIKQKLAVPAGTTAALQTLAGLYSGNQSTMTSSLLNISKQLGVSEDTFNSYMTGNLDAIPGSPGSNSPITSPGGPGLFPGGPGKQPSPNVNIVVQVPDVTSADALKFAQLVKQYLDNSSLMSNTGGI